MAVGKLYGAVTMDIVGSRKIKNRIHIQDKLNTYIEHINSKYKSILPSKICITLGDEWQLITDKPDECYNIIHEFQKLLWLDEIKIYAGIGIGFLSTRVYEDIRKMDGSCFSLAREALEIAKTKYTKRSNLIHSRENHVYFKHDKVVSNKLFFKEDYKPDPCENHREIAITQDINRQVGTYGRSEYGQTLCIETVLNNIIENNEILKEKMTSSQKKIYYLYGELGSYNRIIDFLEGKPFAEDDKRIAGFYIRNMSSSRESESGISQKLNSANYWTIQHNQMMVSKLINYFFNLGDVSQ